MSLFPTGDLQGPRVPPSSNWLSCSCQSSYTLLEVVSQRSGGEWSPGGGEHLEVALTHCSGLTSPGCGHDLRAGGGFPQPHSYTPASVLPWTAMWLLTPPVTGDRSESLSSSAQSPSPLLGKQITPKLPPGGPTEPCSCAKRAFYCEVGILVRDMAFSVTCSG